MADVYVIQHAFQGESGIPKDQMVNTFHATLRVGDVVSWTSAANAIKEFYYAPTTVTTVNIASFLSGTLRSFPATIKAYRLMNPPHAAPVYEESYDPLAAGLSGVSDKTVPFEVACCLSYNASPVGGVSPGRLRGRIFLGPLNDGALGIDGRPVVSLLDTLRAAGARLQTNLPLSGLHWCVYSPTRTAEGGADPVASDILYVSTDDAWDTQRRRGNGPTARVAQYLG